MKSTTRRVLSVLTLSVAFLATAAFADGTVSITITGSSDDIVKIVQHLKDMGLSVGQSVAAPGDPAKVTVPVAASAPAAAPAAPGALNAQTLVGTTWEAGGYTSVFNAAGKLKTNDTDGTWAVDGNKVKVSVSGRDLELEIQGDKLLYKGTPLNKIDKPAAAPAASAEKAATAATAAPKTAAIDAQTIVGTKWEAGEYTTTFNAGGKLKVNDMDGTWAIDGNKLKISVGGRDLDLEIKGDKIIFEGSPLVRK